jgi:hypothetical protein
MKDCRDCQQLRKYAYWTWKTNQAIGKVPLMGFMIRKVLRDIWMGKIFIMGFNFHKEMEQEKNARARAKETDLP